MKSDSEDIKLTMHDAIANLLVIAEMEEDAEHPIGIINGNKLVVQDKEFSHVVLNELLPDNAQQILDILENSLFVILSYLKDLVKDKETDWESSETIEAIQSMMGLVGEVSSKLNGYLSLFSDYSEKMDITKSKVYIELQNYYLKNIENKIDTGLEGDAAWEDEWKRNDHSTLLDIDKRGLKNFETIKKDKEYELFYLTDEDGEKYFSHELIRNIKLVCDFDEQPNIKMEEDPLLHIRNIQDRDLQASAFQILHMIKNDTEKFYHTFKNKKENELVYLLNESLMALMLSANSKNLIKNTKGKSSISYFEDFQLFLRKSLMCEYYQKMLSFPDNCKDSKSKCLLNLIHHLCQAFFLRSSGTISEVIGLLRLLKRKGGELRSKKGKDLSFWNQLLQEDDDIRLILRCFPSGPLFKILDLIRNQEEGKEVGFDPILLGNLPYILFEIDINDKKCNVTRLPCPTKQLKPSKVEIIPEFIGFLRSYGSEEKKKKHLIVNLQDRTSWKEYARSHKIEELQKQVEFAVDLNVITLAKDTDFYYQNKEYFNIDKTKDFIFLFKQQIMSPDDYGFFFANLIKDKKFIEFIDKLFILIHENFFDNKGLLSRKERLDFIEIFYFFVICKVIEITDPDTISFSCKDAVDAGATQAASFYAFLRIINNHKWSKEENDFFSWIAYAPGFLVRDRAVDSQRLFREISALASMDESIKDHYQKIQKNFDPLFKKHFFKLLLE